MDPVIFLHIPKTAGSTFHTFLNQVYSAHKIWNVNGASLRDQSILEFIKAPKSERDGVLLLKGHMPFGLHEHLPGCPKYITFLRHPVRRTVSSFLYVNRPTSSRYELARRFDGSISAFIESGLAPGMDNAQTRWLTGTIKGVPFGQITRTHLERAWDNILEHFAAVGITERFLESIDLFAHKLQWSGVPPITRENVARRKSYSLTDSDRVVIEEHNQFDLELYERASARLDDCLRNENAKKVATEVEEDSTFRRIASRILRGYVRGDL